MVGKILKVPRSFRLSRFQGNLDKLQCVVAVKKNLIFVIWNYGYLFLLNKSSSLQDDPVLSTP